MDVYYNELDPYPAQWLRNLIDAGLIPAGTVDGRDIKEVRPGDVAPTSHFFAGIGGWAHALELAGWDPAEPVWTASLPCQPFSVAGKGLGEADERHLWPVFRDLVAECRPRTIFGEQVANATGWLDGVFGDLEAEGYTCGAVVLGAHSVGAPHIRQRLYWVAQSNGWRQSGIAESSDDDQFCSDPWDCPHCADLNQRLAYSERDSRGQGRTPGEPGEGAGTQGAGAPTEPRRRSDAGGMGDAERSASSRLRLECLSLESEQETRRPSDATPWSDSIFIGCADGKQRRIEPSIQPLAHGVSARVGRLRAYGNAIVPQVAAEFVRAFMESRACRTSTTRESTALS